MPQTHSRTVIYDDECGFCRRWVDLGRKLDWFKRLDWKARLDPAARAAFPQVSDAKSEREMISIRPDGRLYGGFYALRDISIRLPLTFLPALLLYLPGAPLLGVPAYKWVAKNRHAFSSCPAKKG